MAEWITFSVEKRPVLVNLDNVTHIQNGNLQIGSRVHAYVLFTDGSKILIDQTVDEVNETFAGRVWGRV